MIGKNGMIVFHVYSAKRKAGRAAVGECFM